MKLFVVTVFLISYFLIAVKRKWQLRVTYLAIALLITAKAISPKEAFLAVNLNVLGIFFGVMVLSLLFVFSGAPAYLANRLISKFQNQAVIFLTLCAISGFISLFIENIATLLIVAPIAFEICRRLKANPVALLIGIAISSNLQGCATLIGDPPSMLLASFSKMSFNDFFWMNGRPGIFFAVQLGALVSLGMLYRVFRRREHSGKEGAYPVREKFSNGVKSWVPSALMILLVVSLIAYSFFPQNFPCAMALICIFYAGLGILWQLIFHKESISLLKDLDWQTLFFLVGIFVIVGSLVTSGVVADFAKWFSSFVGGNKFLAYISTVWFSVFASAFVDNVPYTMTMLPVAEITAGNQGVLPHLFFFGLLIGTCLGGNITPIGAGANIASVGLLKKEGYRVSFLEFVKIGFPFTLLSVVCSSLFIWVFWA